MKLFKIKESTHGVIGLGDVELLYNEELKELVYNAHDEEILVITGPKAKLNYDLISGNPVDIIAEVNARCLATFGNSLPTYSTRSRVRHLTEKRQIIMHWLTNNTEMNLGQIGRILNRDHSTVIHAVKQVDNLLKYDKSFRSLYNKFAE